MPIVLVMFAAIETFHEQQFERVLNLAQSGEPAEVLPLASRFDFQSSRNGVDQPKA